MGHVTIPKLDQTAVQQLHRIASEEGLPIEEALRRLIAESARNRRPRHLDAIFPVPTD
jgi:hypothetical protein